MLKLIKCEFWKMKRRKIIVLLLLLAVIFPLVAVYGTKAGMTGEQSLHYLKSRFDYAYNITLGYGLIFLMPCLIGVLGAVLFFEERDCDTFKNLRMVPISHTRLIFAKIGVLFLFGIVFSTICIASITVLTKLAGTGYVYGLPYKFGMGILFGTLITGASLPIIVLIIYFNKSHLLSLLLAFFYSIFNWGVFGMIGAAISDTAITAMNCVPVLCVMNWVSGSMIKNTINDNLMNDAFRMIPSTQHAVFVLGITVALSLGLIIRFYKKWTR